MTKKTYLGLEWPHWLDKARERDNEALAPLRRLVQLWVVGWNPPIDATIRADLEPLPDVPADTARLLVRDEFNTYAADHPPKQRVQLVDDEAHASGLSLQLFQHTGGTALYDLLFNFVMDALMSPPKFGWKACAQCGETFAPLRTKAIYCGTNCRMAAYYARKTGKQA